jgi:hypothetical protein
LSPGHGMVAVPPEDHGGAELGDLIVWDGVPVAQSESARGPVPCFPYLGTLRSGAAQVLRFVARARQASPVDQLAAELPADYEIFAFRSAQDSLAPKPDQQTCRGALVVPASTDLHEVEHWLKQSQSEHAGLSVAMPALFERLGQTEMAGKAHRLWLSLDRVHPRA